MVIKIVRIIRNFNTFRNNYLQNVNQKMNNITLYTLLIITVLTGQISFAQENVVYRITLDKYDNGQILREHIKYHNKDTVVELIYFQNGQLKDKRQLLNNQRTGWSYSYNEKGELIFQNNYLNGNLTGVFKTFYPTGQISIIAYYKNNKKIDTTTYYNENGQVIKKVAFLLPCEFGSPECNQSVVIYENDSKIYSYEVVNGMKSENHTVYDQTVYQKIKAHEDKKPLHEKGKMIFQSNCGMCHKLDKPIIGPALNCITKTKKKDELTKIIVGKQGHPISKLTDKEIEALIEYINKNCQ